MRRKKPQSSDENIKIYPDVMPGRAHGAFFTQAGTDKSGRSEQTNVVKSSDGNVKSEHR